MGKEREGRRESRGIIGQNNGQPFRDNDELALRFAYEYTYIYYALSISSERRFMESGKISKLIIGAIANSETDKVPSDSVPNPNDECQIKNI
jgi:hypothetical protein